MDDEALEPRIGETAPLLPVLTLSPPKSFDYKSFARRPTFWVYVVIICSTLGTSMQIVPRVQIYEAIICRNYYGGIDNQEGESYNRLCKVKAVQKELSLVQGIERLTELVPALLAIPYRYLANRYGGRNILALALLGVVLAETWGMVVCYFSKFFPIRLLWTQFMFELMGGGPSVVSTMAFLIVADVETSGSRSIVFFRLHAAAIIAVMMGPSFGSLLIRYNPWLPWIIGESLSFLNIFISLLLPNTTLKLTSDDSLVHGSPTEPEGTVSEGTPPKTSPHHRIGTSLASTLRFLSNASQFIGKNQQVLLLLSIALLGHLGSDSLLTIILLYMSKRYHWSFAKAGFLWSMGAGTQLILLLIILPLANHTLLLRFKLSARAIDRYIALGSSLSLTFGALCLGLAPKVDLVILGVVFMSMGTGLISLVRSLLTTSVSPKNVSVAYSLMTVLGVVGTSVAGPIYAGIFSAGLALGPAWYGLPYLVAGSVLALSFTMIIFVDTGRRYVDGQEEEQEVE